VVRILIVDDHDLFRKGLRHLLNGFDAELEIVEAADCDQAIALAGERFELVLLDLHMPRIAGLDALERVRPAFEASPIVVLSGEDDPRQVRRAIDAGAAGFIPKSSTPDVLRSALRLVLAGEVYLPAVALKGIDEGAGDAPTLTSSRFGEGLSERQVDVLRKAVQGKPNKVIARELGISEGTVKAHLSAAYRALGVHNRTEAVYAAARCGLQLKP
jgi:DNA-binding NarL/FixJ family response regulator